MLRPSGRVAYKLLLFVLRLGCDACRFGFLAGCVGYALAQANIALIHVLLRQPVATVGTPGWEHRLSLACEVVCVLGCWLWLWRTSWPRLRRDRDPHVRALAARLEVTRRILSGRRSAPELEPRDSEARRGQA